MKYKVLSIFFIFTFIISNKCFSQIGSIFHRKEKTEVNCQKTKTDSCDILNKGENFIVLIKSDNNTKKTIIDKFPDYFSFLLGALISVGVTQLNNLIEKRKMQKKYDSTLNYYISTILATHSMGKIKKDTYYNSLLFPFVGEYSGVKIKPELLKKISKTIDEINSYNDDDSNLPSTFRQKIKDIWSLE